MNPQNYIVIAMLVVFAIVILSSLIFIPWYVYGAQSDIITPYNTGNNNNKTVVTDQLNICVQYDPKHCDIIPQGVKIPISILPQTPNYLQD